MEDTAGAVPESSGQEGTFNRRSFLRASGALGLGSMLAVHLRSTGPALRADTRRHSASKTLTKVSFMLPFFPGITATWLYVAKEQGYFQHEGIDVAIQVPPNGTISADVDFVSVGKIDIAFGSPPLIALARERGAKVLAICNIVPGRDDGLISLPKKPIHEPSDLVGQTVVNYKTPILEAELSTFLKYGNVSPSKVTIQYAAFTPPLLAAGKCSAAVGAYYGERVDVASLTHSTPVWLPFTKFGTPQFPFYSLMTSESYASANPGLIRRFLVASMRGLKKSLEDFSAASQALHVFATGPDNTGTYSSQVAQFDAIKPYFLPPGIKVGNGPYGLQDASKWTAMIDWAHEYKILPKVIDPQHFVTNEFMTEAAKYPKI